MAPEMDGTNHAWPEEGESNPKLDCREIIALANRRETERLANEIQKNTERLTSNIQETGELKEDTASSIILREVAERSEGDPPKKFEDSDKLDRLEILVNNLTSMFRTVFGDHALISGHWVDLTGGVDVALMRDKAGYDRSGNLKLDVPAKGEG